MAAININRIVLTARLTKDPTLKELPSGTSVCEMRLACNARRKNGSTGEWEDRPNFFDVNVWGAQGENAARYLSKGRAVAIDGRLEWREWEAQDGTKRQAVVIVADAVQFLGSRAAGEGEEDPGDYAIPEDLPVPAGVGAEDPAGPTDDEDIPF